MLKSHNIIYFFIFVKFCFFIFCYKKHSFGQKCPPRVFKEIWKKIFLRRIFPLKIEKRFGSSRVKRFFILYIILMFWITILLFKSEMKCFISKPFSLEFLLCFSINWHLLFIPRFLSFLFSLIISLFLLFPLLLWKRFDLLFSFLFIRKLFSIGKNNHIKKAKRKYLSFYNIFIMFIFCVIKNCVIWKQ